ncbi:MAG: hypothetical protein WA177_20615, partial [Xanthobacteraceae bacterium]
MTAAAEARRHWARRRSRGAAGAPLPGETGARAGTALSLFLALAAIACAAVGLIETQRHDSRLATEQHAALQAALVDLQTGS